MSTPLPTATDETIHGLDPGTISLTTFFAGEDSALTPLANVTLKYSVADILGAVGRLADITMGNGKAIKVTQANLDTFNFQAYDVDGAAYLTFMSLRSSNTPRLLIASPSGGQLLLDSFGGTFTINSATIGNTTPAAATFTGINLSTGGAIKTGTSIANQFILQAYDVDGGVYKDFITFTANNTPSCAIGAPTGGSLTIDAAVLGGNSPISILQASSITSNAIIGNDSISVNFGHPVQFYNAGNTFFTALKGGVSLVSRTFTLPIDFPASTQALVCDVSGNFSFSAFSPGMNFVNQTSSTVTMVANTAYFINNGASLVTLTLPTTFAAGDVFRIIGFSSGGWKIAQPASKSIQVGGNTSTVGTSGFIASTAASDGIEIVGIVANTTLANYVAPQGDITVI